MSLRGAKGFGAICLENAGGDIVVDGYHVATGAYFLSNGRQVKVMAVNHPSVGYPWDYWNRVIQDFLL